MIQSILQIDQEYDFWNDLPDAVKDDVEEAMKQGDRGEGQTHEELMKKYIK